jgi:hypothetical protein
MLRTAIILPITKKLSSLLTPSAVFENIAVHLKLRSRDQITDQLESAKDFFKSRMLAINGFRHSTDYTEIDLISNSILSIPVAKFKKGDLLTRNGKMVFKFDDALIAEIIFFPDQFLFFNEMI